MMRFWTGLGNKDWEPDFMKILFIYPTITQFGKDVSPTSSIPPLGIAYIAAHAEKLGHEVEILDCVSEGILNTQVTGEYTRTGVSDEDIERRIRNSSPDLVGISSMFSAYCHDTYRVADLVKKIDPNVLVVLGGAHVVSMTENCLKQESVDICVLGEGEQTFGELITKITEGKSYHCIDGIAYRKNGKTIFTKERELIEEMDQLSFPARHLLPMDTYFSNHINPYAYHAKHTFMMTSRGCPKKCVFCSIQSVWKYKWRTHSAEYVVDEIEHLVKNYGIKEVHFVDDNLTAGPQRALRICQLLVERKIKIKWTCPNGVAIWTLNKELLDWMKKSGCYRLTFGIESGSAETQKFIKKDLDLDQAREMLAYANKIGLWTVSTFIFGFPYQDQQQIDDSVDFALTSGTDFATFYTLMPFNDTPLWKVLKEEDMVDEEDFLADIGYYLSTRGLDSKHFTHQEIQSLANGATRKMLKRQVVRVLSDPGHYLRKIGSFEDLGYFARLLKNYLAIAKNSFLKGDVGGSVYWNRNKAMTRQ